MDVRKAEASLVGKVVEDALELLFRNDGFLLEADAHERTIAAKLAHYMMLSARFPQHQIDVEYNRHGLEPKAVALPEYYRGDFKQRVFPDLIVHQRGHDNENVLVIQIKKETNPEPRLHDAAVIDAMKREFSYRHGLLIDLPAGRGAVNRKPLLEWR
jgi:hypothetical protein